MARFAKLMGVICATCLTMTHPASAQFADPYAVNPPIDYLYGYDWSHFYENDSTAGFVPVKQSDAQIAANRARLTPPASAQALQMARESFVTPLRQQAAELGSIAERALTDPRKTLAYRDMLTDIGLNPDDCADVMTAYTLSTYSLAHTAKPGYFGINPAEIEAVRTATREMLVTYMPPEISAQDLRYMVEHIRAEHILQNDLLAMSRDDAADDRA